MPVHYTLLKWFLHALLMVICPKSRNETTINFPLPQLSRQTRPLYIDPKHHRLMMGLKEFCRAIKTKYHPMWASQLVSWYQEMIGITRNPQFNKYNEFHDQSCLQICPNKSKTRPEKPFSSHHSARNLLPYNWFSFCIIKNSTFPFSSQQTLRSQSNFPPLSCESCKLNFPWKQWSISDSARMRSKQWNTNLRLHHHF